ncbi:MAG: sugar ABC transporter substrate-binding protein [Lachnospiraceae bacterium]|nr:sugar ABC transporter substrate-binding protein [Lachnospiraceae bacterium]
MKKKMVTLMLTVCCSMGLLLTGCGSSDNTSSSADTSSDTTATEEDTTDVAAAEEEGEELQKIALLTAMGGSESWQNRIELATTLDEEYGFEVTNIDCDGNVTTQAQQIESCMESGYDAIIISPADVSAIITTVEKATEAGVPVVSTEGVFEGASACVTIPEYDSAYYMGTQAAEWLNENWPDKTELNVMDMNYEFLENCIERNTGFMDGLKDNCNATINVVSDVSPTTTVEAESMAESALQADSIDVCMSTNGDFLYGFVLACENLGVDLDTVAGFIMDATASSLQYLKEGKVIKGICAWSTPQGQVEYWLEATQYVLSDEYDASEGCKEYDLDYLYITDENVDQAMIDFGVTE